MAGYSTVKYGSRGSSVSQLQTLLNQNGFGLNVDGIFGDKTQAAVRQYQQRTGLSVDGIVGTNTWGALTGSGGGIPGSVGYTGGAITGSGSASGSTSGYGPGPGSGVYSPLGSPNYASYASYADQYAGARPTYTPSDAYNQALGMLTQYENNRPGAYESPYQAQIDALLGQIQNRDPFQYDFNADPLYQQYKGNYMQLGQQAMMDTMGNAAALSGGYGNSYATTAGSQAYQQYVQQVNGVIPQLRDAAYQMYRDQGADMYNEMGLLRGLDDTGYGRHRDTVGDWQRDRDYYYGKESDLYGRDYGQYMDRYNMWSTDRDFGYQSAYDAQQQANWERDFGQSQSNWEKEYELAARKASGGGGGSKNNTESGLFGQVATADVTDWDAILRAADNAGKQSILYGYTKEGREYMAQIEQEIGKEGLERLRRSYGGSTYGGKK